MNSVRVYFLAFVSLVAILSVVFATSQLDAAEHVRVKRSGGGAPSGGDESNDKTEDETIGIQLNDTEWISGKQWYLEKTKSHTFQTLNARVAWEQCVTGKGVNVAIVANSIIQNNPDLHNNYEAKISYGPFNKTGSSSLNINPADKATQCAGIIAAGANHFCGVGVAFDAKIVGEQMNDKPSDVKLAEALTEHSNKVDVILNILEHTAISPIGQKTMQAIETDIKQGRKSKGTILVTPVGDLGTSCSFNGFINRPESIAVSAIRRNGFKLTDGNHCSAVMATAYSKNQQDTDPIVTVTGNEGCTEDVAGSAPAASFAAGIIALALEANPDLSWRDVQHLIVQTSTSKNVRFNPNDFVKNQQGISVSPSYGFGLMDAGKMVKLAEVWKPVPTANVCVLKSRTQTISVNETSCPGDGEIHYLEHVLVHIKTTLTRCDEGSLHLHLVSPAGTKSALFSGGIKGATRATVDESILSVGFWAENPIGSWKLEFANGCEGLVHEWQLEIRGTIDSPSANQNLTSMNVKTRPCPYKSSLAIKHGGKIDFTPLYIFIVLLLVVTTIGLLIVTYRRCWGSKVKGLIHAEFRAVPTTDVEESAPTSL
ncbi:proprotein convertase subtilisin/kexin type 6-like [Tubulanus polymorphus]|uniref:proprotein convertase subtilisin/kexin type 6-like n=1 Tax=Tubulanus polymorphus TaxID=672921 RepID=UPI003DA271BF